MRDVIEEFLDLAVPQIEGLSVGAEARSAFADILAFYLAQAVGKDEAVKRICLSRGRGDDNLWQPLCRHRGH